MPVVSASMDQTQDDKQWYCNWRFCAAWGSFGFRGGPQVRQCERTNASEPQRHISDSGFAMMKMD